MKYKIIAPVKETTEDFEAIEEAIRDLFRKEIYLPLIRSINGERNILKNSTDDVIDAIESGRIHFYRGEFTGRFNAAVSRELRRMGAEWDRRQGRFKIPFGSLSTDVRNAVLVSEDRLRRATQKLNDQIDKILPEKISDKLHVEKMFDTTLWKVDKALNKTLGNLTVMPKLTKEGRARIATEYTNNLKLYIKDWTEKEIVQLRKRVQASTMQGYRYEKMVKTIQDSYDVSLNKAKFLARQETSIMMAKFKGERLREAGVDDYVWGCVAGSKNHPVRPEHKALEGKKFRFDNPPTVNKNGERKNPGEDYGCRCFARPVVKF